ncbi:hypothetical protein P7K49_008820 [Saguinus oedipus]|uniref:Uncharacterized protein n=1 Tax=Saguinus oedipus TaxID=9490 RepID=A0ABQ9VYU0_SAGOE|nr:hypothetical protein P7K49_008820 [Saguinus oedipus]
MVKLDHEKETYNKVNAMSKIEQRRVKSLQGNAETERASSFHIVKLVVKSCTSNLTTPSTSLLTSEKTSALRPK